MLTPTPGRIAPGTMAQDWLASHVGLVSRQSCTLVSAASRAGRTFAVTTPTWRAAMATLKNVEERILSKTGIGR